MKSSAKRRRSKAEILAEKEAALKKELEIKEKLAAWSQLEAALEESERKRQKQDVFIAETQKMFDDGVLKQTPDGKY